jgi:hypothetical protein
MGHGIDPESFEAFQINVLDVKRRRFKDDLILVVVLKPIGVFPVTAIRRTTRRLHIGNLPGLRTKHPQKGGWVKGAGPNFDVIGLLEHAVPASPKIFQ